MQSDWVSDVQEQLAAFTTARDWDQYHTARNLAALIASESGELLALFRWDQDALSEAPEAVRHELADVLIGVLRFATVSGVNLRDAVEEKIALNAVKYPLNRVSGPDLPQT